MLPEWSLSQKYIYTVKTFVHRVKCKPHTLNISLLIFLSSLAISHLNYYSLLAKIDPNNYKIIIHAETTPEATQLNYEKHLPKTVSTCTKPKLLVNWDCTWRNFFQKTNFWKKYRTEQTHKMRRDGIWNGKKQRERHNKAIINGTQN